MENNSEPQQTQSPINSSPQIPQDPVNQQPLLENQGKNQVVSVGILQSLTPLQEVAIIAGALIVIAVTAVVAIAAKGTPLTSWEIQAANNSVNEMSADVTASDTNLGTMESATTLSGFNSADNELSSKLSDAQKQFILLNTSPVLKDLDTLSKFGPLKSSWNTYYSFVRNTLSDYKTLGPILINLGTAQQHIFSSSIKPSSNLNSELGQYKSIVDSASQQAAALKMYTTPDQQMLSALKNYIKSSNTDISQTQLNLTGNSSVNTITADITLITAAATQFSETHDSLTSSASSSSQNYSLGKNINAFSTALNNLSSKTSN